MRKQWTSLMALGAVLITGPIMAQTTQPASTDAQPKVEPKPAATQPAGLQTDAEKLSYFLGTDVAMGAMRQGDQLDPEVMKKALQAAKGLDMDQLISFIAGIQVAAQLQQLGVEADGEAMAMGMEDLMKGNMPKVRQQEVQQIVEALQAKLMEADQKKNEAWFADYDKTEGVTKMDSGLRVRFLKKAEGAAKPKDSDTATVAYKLMLTDGTMIESSFENGRHIQYEMDGKGIPLLPGFVEAIKTMGKGDKIVAIIPPEIGYGQQQAGSIPPNSILMFEMELLDFKPTPPRSNAPGQPLITPQPTTQPSE